MEKTRTGRALLYCWPLKPLIAALIGVLDANLSGSSSLKRLNAPSKSATVIAVIETMGAAISTMEYDFGTTISQRAPELHFVQAMRQHMAITTAAARLAVHRRIDMR